MHNYFIGVLKHFFPAHAAVYNDINLYIAIQNNIISTYFPDIPFSATTINAGPQTDVQDHRDFRNHLWGICALYIDGINFDWRLHGHLKLKEAKLILELQPGDIFIMPSASITHGNTNIVPGEIRRSIVFYSAAAFARFIRNGHITQKNVSEEMLAQSTSEKGTRLERGANLFLTETELQEWLQTQNKNIWHNRAKEFMELLVSNNRVMYPTDNSDLAKLSSWGGKGSSATN